jgi:peptidoglycan/xylan/chitin deacetylase (PgdA/CDA1 family)
MTKVWISVDVEPDISEYLSGSTLGLSEALPRLLDLFDALSIPVDFFVLGKVADHDPHLVKEISSRGYEVGSHGDSHSLLCTGPLRSQRLRIRQSVRAVTSATKSPVRFFRAPNFSADGNTVRVLEELGIPFDSSVLPGRVLRRWRILNAYDHRRAPKSAYVPSKTDIDRPGSSKVLEIPVTENPLQPGTPIGLGFLNAHSGKETLRALTAAAGEYVAFLIHPWEAVDLAAARPYLPEWISRACTSDLEPLRAFLTELDGRGSFVTIDSIASDLGAPS